MPTAPFFKAAVKKNIENIDSDVQTTGQSYVDNDIEQARDIRTIASSTSAVRGVVVSCQGAAVLGVLYRDSRVPPYSAGYLHSGLDIFGAGRENTVPVYAVADGLLTRLPNWKSVVIIQHDDPLRQDEMVWTYYSHMAGAGDKSYIVEDFPPGSAGVPVVVGQLLGYQGVWSGHLSGLYLSQDPRMDRGRCRQIRVGRAV